MPLDGLGVRYGKNTERTMGSLGKQKGAQFERDVCKDLSLWISKGKRKDLFWRSAMSGGRATLAKKKGEKLKNQAGDITAIDPKGNILTNIFMVECKFYKSLNIEALIIKNKGKLIQFWDKAVLEANAYKKLPLLICKQNRLPALLCVNKKGMDFFIKRKNTNINHIYLFKNKLHIFIFEEFLKKYRIKKEKQ